MLITSSRWRGAEQPVAPRRRRPMRFHACEARGFLRFSTRPAKSGSRSPRQRGEQLVAGRQPIRNGPPDPAGSAPRQRKALAPAPARGRDGAEAVRVIRRRSACDPGPRPRGSRPRSEIATPALGLSAENHKCARRRRTPRQQHREHADPWRRGRERRRQRARTRQRSGRANRRGWPRELSSAG